MAELTHKEKQAKAKRDYRLGQKSVRTIADEIGVSHTTVNKWIRKNRWKQDKSSEVLERTRAALATPPPGCPEKPQEGGSKGGSNRVSTGKRVSTKPREVEIAGIDDEAAIDIAVKTNLAVIRGHRRQLKHKLTLVDMFSQQLEDVGQSRERIIELIMKEDASHQQRAAMLKAVSLPSHASVLKDLSVALRNMIPLERQAFGLDEKAGPPPPPLADSLTDEQREALQRVADVLAREVTKQ